MSAWSGRGRQVLSRVCTRKEGSPQPRRALSCARPARLPDPALNIWVSRGGPGRVRRAARLGSLPTLLPGSRLPSPVSSEDCGTPTRTLPKIALLGRLLPSRVPQVPGGGPPFYRPDPQRPRQPKILLPGTRCCSTADFLALPFSSFLLC